MNKYTTEFVKRDTNKSYDSYMGYAGYSAWYLRMKFNRPRKTSQYIKMLKLIQKNPKITRKSILNIVSNGHSDWQILTAMMEYDFILNVGRKNRHEYIITKRGLKLLDIADQRA